MQFRERRRVIQVIRTTYDPELKRGRSEVVGKLDKDAPVVTEKLQKACSPEELAEVAAYLSERTQTLRSEAVRAGAETLPAQMRKAAEYFSVHGDAEARVFAAEIRSAWEELKAAMRRSGFSKARVLKPAPGAPKPAPAKEAAAKPAPPPRASKSAAAQ